MSEAVHDEVALVSARDSKARDRAVGDVAPGRPAREAAVENDGPDAEPAEELD